MLSRTLMMEATKNCDSHFDGSFFLAVLSTRIYCIPSCKAKMPLEKNVKFFETKEQAVTEGFRGCKRCRSEFFPNNEPEWLNPLIDEMQNGFAKKLTSKDFEIFTGVDITTIRRYFKIYKRTSPSSYHRTMRLRYARKLIKKGIDIATVPYLCGFDSLSGFRDAFVREFRVLPGEYNDNQTARIQH